MTGKHGKPRRPSEPSPFVFRIETWSVHPSHIPPTGLPKKKTAAKQLISISPLDLGKLIIPPRSGVQQPKLGYTS